MLFRDFARGYLKRQEYLWAKSTQRDKESQLQKNLLPLLGDKEVQELKPLDLDEVAAKIYSNVGSKKAALIVYLLVQILRDATKNNYSHVQWEIPPSPRKIKKQFKSTLSKDEVLAVINYVAPHYQDLFRFCYWTGMRPGEVKALKWENIDLASKKIYVSESRDRTGSEGTTKTGIVRYIDIHQKLLNLLTKIERNGTSYLFVDRKGLPINDHLDRIWRTAVKKLNTENKESGVPAVPSYELRHAFATSAIYAGMATPHLSRLLGHANITTTHDFYVGILEQHSAEESAKLNGAFQ